MPVSPPVRDTVGSIPLLPDAGSHRRPVPGRQHGPHSLYVATHLPGPKRERSRASRKRAAVYRHSKILVAAMNGPVIGLSAALLGYFDFIFSVDDAYFLTPFSAISLVCEGGSSQSLVQRMGLAKANECALLTIPSPRKSC